MPYPVWAAGQRVTAALLTAMQPIEAVKSTATPRASNTVLTADPHLTLAVAANAAYDLSGFIAYDGQYNAGNLLLDWTLPAGARMLWSANGPAVGGTAAFASNTVLAGTGNPLSAGTYGTGGSYTALNPRGRLVTGASAGSITLTWAQVTSNAMATTLRADSRIQLDRTS
jgi:hypothetical protein